MAPIIIKRRTRSKPKRPEQELQRQLVNAFKVILFPSTFWAAVPNGGYRTPIEGAIFKGQGVRAGVPDLFLVHQGKVFWLELKSQDGRLSPVQRQIHDELRQAGCRVEVARSINEAMSHLCSFGIPLRGTYHDAVARAIA